MSQGEKISVCLPVYNGTRYLTDAIESVLRQTHPDFELLIADDRSTDDSNQIASRYAAQDPRVVYWVNETNKGIFANYNECLKRVSGAYVKLFAQDDILEPTCLERLLKQLRDNKNLSLVTAARAVIDPEGKQTAIERFFDKTTVISGIDVIKEYARSFVYRTGTPSQVMFRRESVGEGFKAVYTLSGDIEYFFRILEGGDYMYLDEVLVKFRRHPESATVLSLKDMSFVADSYRIFDKYASYAIERGQNAELFHRPLMENLVRKVNNAIYDRKIDLSSVVADRTADGDGEPVLDFERIAFQFLIYASQLKMQLEQKEAHLKKREEEFKSMTNGQHNAEGQENLHETVNDLTKQLDDLKNSSSWRLTQPLRWLSRTMR